MPKEHQYYLEWNGDRFRKWAEGIGENTARVIDSILRSKRVEQQSYRACMGLLKMADKYSPARLESLQAKVKHFNISFDVTAFCCRNLPGELYSAYHGI